MRSPRNPIARLSRVFVVLAVLAAAACSVFGSSLDPFTEGGGGPGDQCLVGLTRCGDTCVDLQSDPSHCGGCDSACSASQVCDLAACADDCSGGKTNCNSACVELDKDPLHCGDCAIACNVGETCGNGSCNVDCFPGQTACGGSCVDVQADDQHCGQCGNACPTGQKCNGGKCEVSCTPGQTLCTGACVDTQTNQNHCGNCGAACNPGEACSAGQCKIACPGGQTECSGLCYDLLSDDKNCGACGNACQVGDVCGNGQCTANCPAGQDNCSGSCADLQTSSQNCGSCGNACGANEECSAGKCVIACKTLLNQGITDPWGYGWDGLERAAGSFDAAKTVCEGIGGRLPTASELYRVSATQSATVGQTIHTNYLWSLVPNGPSNQIRVRLSDAATSSIAKTGSLNYRCVCAPPQPSAFVGNNCFGPVGTACFGLDSENKKIAIDIQDRPPVPKGSAIWECAFYRGHLVSPARLREALFKGVGTGTNVWLHTADDARSDYDTLMRWQDPKTFTLSTANISYGSTTNLRPFRCAGPNYDAGTHPATLTDEFVGPFGGYKGEKADSAASAWGAAVSACWSRGGHVASATEHAELVGQGLPGGSNAWLWAGDESSVILGNATLQGFRWTGATTPTYATGTDITTLSRTASQAYRCVYYPVDTSYAGPSAADCAGGCKQLALPGTSGAKVWIDDFDRAPAATWDAAADTCRQVGGRLPTGRDYIETIRAGLGNGSNALLWSSDFLAYRGSTTLPYELRVHVVRWTGSVPTFSDAWSTYTSASALTSSRAYRCFWSNEIR